MTKKLIDYFKKFYKKKESRNLVLIERFDYIPSLVNYALLSNVLSDVHDAKIISYYPNSTNFLKLFYQKFKGIFKNKNIDYLYESFGSAGIVKPKINKNKNREIKFKNKLSVQNFKFKNILIGDLMYDEYLRSKSRITINLNDMEFKQHVSNTLNLFDFWYNYILNNPVKAMVISHSVYNMGIVSRIAIKFNIPVYYTGPNGLYYLNNKYLTRHSKNIYKIYKKIFRRIDTKLKTKLLKIAKKNLNERFYGKKDIKLLLDRETTNKSFTKKIKRKKISLKKSSPKKIKIFVAVHQLNDAVHAYGNCIFPDFYEWLNCLGEISEKENFDWILKIHPAEFKENLIYFDFFKKKYPKFKFLKSSFSNSDIIEIEKPDVVTTVFGSGGHEFPLFGIPVVNASNNGPHIGYNFNYNSKSISEYINFIKKAKTLRVQKAQVKKIYEFYVLRFMMEYTPIDNQDYYIKKYETKFMDNYVKIFLDQINEIKQNELYNEVKNFVKSKKFRIYYDKTKEKNKYLKNM